MSNKWIWIWCLSSLAAQIIMQPLKDISVLADVIRETEEERKTVFLSHFFNWILWVSGEEFSQAYTVNFSQFTFSFCIQCFVLRKNAKNWKELTFAKIIFFCLLIFFFCLIELQSFLTKVVIDIFSTDHLR